MVNVNSQVGAYVYRQSARIAVLALLAAAVASCDDVPGADENADENADDAAWLAYELAARIDPEVPGRYVVEGDIFFGDEPRLRRFYEGGLRREGGIQSRAWIETGWGMGVGDTRLEVLNTASQLELTYCISTDATTGFTGALHAQIVDEMHRAAVKWERAADVNFVYVPALDSACTDGTSGVYFAVRKAAVLNPAACARAPFPYEHPLNRILWFKHPIVIGCTDTERTFAHELGHILGMAHEEDRGACADAAYATGDLSEYDTMSLMHSGNFCNVGGNIKNPSRRDVAAVRALYRNPKDNWRHAGINQASDFDDDGKKDIYWYRTEPLLLPAMPPSDRIMYGALAPTFVNSANSPIGNLLRPTAGDFNNDGRTDLFFFETGSGTPGAGVDTLMLKQGANNNAFTTNTLTSLATLNQPLTGYFHSQFETSPTADIIFYGPGPGADPQLAASPGTVAGMTWINTPPPLFTVGDATNWYEPIVGSFDNDTTTDLFFFNPDDSSSHKFYANIAGTGFNGVAPTNKTFMQLTGDHLATFFYSNVTARFNSDRPDDILFYAPTEGTVTFLFGGATGPGTTFATPTNPDITKIYRPFAGDFNGDGNSDVYWFNTASAASDEVWWMSGTGANHTATTSTAGVTDHHERVPIVGDYTGDGLDDILWWLPSTGALSLWTGNANQTFTVNNLQDTVHGFPVGYGMY